MLMSAFERTFWFDLSMLGREVFWVPPYSDTQCDWVAMRGLFFGISNGIVKSWYFYEQIVIRL